MSSPPPSSISAVLLDRDGVLNQDLGTHVLCWNDFRFLPGVIESLCRLAAMDVPVAVVTNQSAIGKGVVPRGIIDDIHQRMTAAIRAAGGRLDGLFLCPHTDEDGCNCRKPKPGLLLQAARELGFDLAGSILIGDSLRDLEAARSAGGRAILVASGHPLPTEAEIARLGPLAVIKDLREAVDWLFPRQQPFRQPRQAR